MGDLPGSPIHGPILTESFKKFILETDKKISKLVGLGFLNLLIPVD